MAVGGMRIERRDFLKDTTKLTGIVRASDPISRKTKTKRHKCNGCAAMTTNLIFCPSCYQDHIEDPDSMK
jgi:hypothetical protein